MKTAIGLTFISAAVAAFTFNNLLLAMGYTFVVGFIADVLFVPKD